MFTSFGRYDDQRLLIPTQEQMLARNISNLTKMEEELFLYDRTKNELSESNIQKVQEREKIKW